MGFAAIAAAQVQGSVLWVRETWLPDVLNPVGIAPFLDPSRLLLARTKMQTDSLAVAEEALKDGATPFVIVEITRPLDLREGRRLQLAAKAGGATGLCMIPAGMGSNAAETRWRAAPLFDAIQEVGDRGDSTLMRWEIIKNKSGTNGAWDVRWDPETRRLHVVSPAGKRPGPEGMSG
jgi:protein ImuA